MPAALHIGGLTIGLESHRDGGIERIMNLPGFGPFATDGIPQLTIELDATLHLPEVQWLHRFGVVDDLAQCHFGRDRSGAYWYLFVNAGLVAAVPAEAALGAVHFDPHTPMRAMISSLPEPNLMRFALWAAYSMLGLGLGRVPVHSSVVVAPSDTAGDVAVLCLGESGTGKSTHTRLWLENIAGATLLNDDSPILAVEDAPDGSGKQVRVYGSPWSGKTPCFRTESHTVAGLLRLEQRPENSIRRLGTIESFTALQPSCPPCLAKDELLTDKLVEYISSIIERVPVYRLGCLPNAEAAHLSHSNIMPC